MTEDRPISERPAARPVRQVAPSAAGSSPNESTQSNADTPEPPKKGMSCTSIGCLSIVVIVVLALVIGPIINSISGSSTGSTRPSGGTSSNSSSGSGGGGSSTGSSTDPIEQARVVLGGAYSYSEVKTATDNALRATGTPVTDEYRSRAWSAVLAATRDLDSASQMEVMRCVAEIGPESGFDFPDAAGLCAADVTLNG